jgi:hypothetical protein
LEVKFKIVGDGIFEYANPSAISYEPGVTGVGYTQQNSIWSYISSKEAKWIVSCLDPFGSVLTHAFPIGQQGSEIPLFYWNVLADPGDNLTVEIEYFNIIGIDYINNFACDDDCCAFPDNEIGFQKATPNDMLCPMALSVSFKEQTTNAPGEEVTYSIVLENNGSPINYESLDLRLRFEDVYETISEIGFSSFIVPPSHKEENLDENGAGPGETGTFYYHFSNGSLQSGETVVLDIVILDPEGFENLLGVGNLTLEFIRIKTATECCQLDGLPATGQVVFPGVPMCGYSPHQLAIRELEYPDPYDPCETGFQVQFESPGSWLVEKLYLEIDIETSGVLAFDRIDVNGIPACFSVCTGNCLATCSTNHIVIDFEDYANPAVFLQNSFLEFVYNGNNGSIGSATITSMVVDLVGEDACILPVRYDPSLQYPIEKCDYCTEVAVSANEYIGPYPLEEGCEEGFSLLVDFGSTLVDRLTMEFTLDVNAGGSVAIDEEASNSFCDTENNICDPGSGVSSCFEINGNTVTLDICYNNGQAFGNGANVLNLVLNGTGIVSGITFTKLSVQTCNPPNGCLETCDVKYLGNASGPFPLTPTVNPSACQDEWTIAGVIHEGPGQDSGPVGDVEVCIAETPMAYINEAILCSNPVASMTTAAGSPPAYNDCNGNYGQTFNYNGNTLFVTPIKDCNPLNGVSTYDMVLISRHILGVQPFDSPYKIIAADVNRSGTVSTFDNVLIRKVILQIDPDFGANTSWRFIPADYIFPNPSNPFAPTFPEWIELDASQSPVMDADFIGIKIGDVNNSALGCKECGTNLAPTTIDERGSTFFEFLHNAPMKIGESRALEFALAPRKDLVAWQLGLRFNPNMLEFEDVEESGLDGSGLKRNFGLTEITDGKIRALWYAEDGRPVGFRSTDGVVRLRFKALQDIQDVSKHIGLDDRVLQNLAYDEAGNAFRITNGSEKANNTTAFPGGAPSAKAAPNPFKKEVVFSVGLPESSPVEITVYDVFGRQVANWKGILDAGLSNVSFTETAVWGNGVFTYVVKTPLQTLTGSVVKQ